MKKIFLFGLISTLSISVFAEVQQKFVGDALKEEQTRIDKIIAGLTEKDYNSKFRRSVEKSLLTIDVNTMDDVVSNEAKVLATFSADEQAKIKLSYPPEIAKASYQAIVWWFSSSLISKALKFYDSKEMTEIVLCFLTYKNPNELGITDKESFDLYSKYLLISNNSNAKYVKRMLDKYVDLCSKVDDNSAAKTVLKKLNLKYTKKLIDDKTTWEPIVALIRTTLEVL